MALINNSWAPQTANHGEEITLSDTEDLPLVAQGIAVFGAGAIKYTDPFGNDHTKTFSVGIWSIAMKRIWDTDTDVDAADLLALID